MGIQDRDYYREGPSFLDRVGQQGATVWLIAITCGVFLGQCITGAPLRGPLTVIGIYDPKLIMQGEIWRLFTPIFLHADLWHLAVNMLVLYFVGRGLEEVYGSREFVLLYLIAGLFANVAYLGLQVVELVALTRAVGASGAVMAILVVYAFHFPRQKVLLFFVIPMPIWLMVVLFAALDLMGAFGGRPDSKTAFVVHLAGLLFGLVYFQTGWQFSRLFTRGTKTRVRPKLRVTPPPVEEEEEEPEPVGAPVEAASRPTEAADEQLEAKLDAVLAKVSKYGQESLTPEERAILLKASEVYKKRRK
ncbi:MAG: rhomboid family intramembrane serine protease [Planctomycetia bacterium]|nr:rhomboid family intramembrane serine protease [Planctomycetia bacterium]